MDREAVSKVIFPNDQFRLGKWQSLREMLYTAAEGMEAYYFNHLKQKWRQVQANAEMANICY